MLSGHQYSQKPQFAVISLNESDKLRIIQFPLHIIDVVRNAIRNSWRRGIQREREYFGSLEFKLKGNPWYGSGSEAVPARQLVLSVLRDLYYNGWQVMMTTDISSGLYDKDTILFRQIQPNPMASFFSISLNETDKLRVIFPFGLRAEESIVSCVRESIRNHWKKGIQAEKIYDGAQEFKLKGNPWWGSYDESVYSRLLVLELLSGLDYMGWKLYASIDQSIGYENRSEKDTWYFIKDK
jgi:hypothetical protein